MHHCMLFLQVDEIGYRETVLQPGLRKYWDRIKVRLDIDWSKTTWNDLEKPLYSGLAARLFLARLSAPIPNLPIFRTPFLLLKYEKVQLFSAPGEREI